MRAGCEVVVTGLGATTPLGGTAGETWAGVLPARLAARAAVEPGDDLSAARRRRLDRPSLFALAAAREAWEQAGRPGVAPERLAVVVGTGIGGGLTTLAQHDVLRAAGPTGMSPFTVPMLMPNAAAAVVSQDLGARAGAHAPTSACAAGAEAVALGVDLLRAGRCDVVVAGGTEACIHPFALGAFGRMGALSTRHDDPDAASRPFDRDRDGFVMAEGAAVLVLQRGDDVAPARRLARLAGAGISSDALDIVAPDPAGQVAAMHSALTDAGLDRADVDWVHAHATSTPKGDVVEASAIARAVRPGVPTTATKSSTGHLLGASGALAAVVGVLGLRDGLVPAIRNLVERAPGVDLDLVRGGPRRLPRATAALCNAFGFGGHNVSLVFTT